MSGDSRADADLGVSTYNRRAFWNGILVMSLAISLT
jgi:hypothetical protein